MRILVAEDERDLNEILCKKLRSEDYCVDGCFDGEEALDYLASVEYDAVILDIMMPKRSGLQVVEQLRRQGDHTPVLFLTARDSIDDRVTGLDAGADDYLVKPFAFDELLARLRVMTRKRGGERSNLFTIDDLTLDIRSKRVERGGVELKLSAKEYALLEYLIRTYTRPGETVLDNCMGSGSTGVACVHTGRRFVGMEQDEQYFAVAERRIAEAGEGLAA